ncbi:hypothetical protein [Agriterribacter sp.]|uniref:hypothetical protein n=1 Tax=Agriterribacter sp. TaxID=2821509 RepID=UPI002B7E980E|nr:hypothetical protein [Agriterribacter sp.]HRO45981.1 hypothetical protein [Agriterribacter sp.]
MGYGKEYARLCSAFVLRNYLKPQIPESTSNINEKILFNPSLFYSLYIAGDAAIHNEVV